MSRHHEFIISPMKNILKEALVSLDGIGEGIDTYPLNSYIIQSIFLRLTGFQEQKLKCVAWEMATYDFEYRVDWLKNSSRGYSAYDDKNDLFKELCSFISQGKIREFYSFFRSNRNKIVDEIQMLMENSNLIIWNQKKYNYFKEHKNIFDNFLYENNQSNANQNKKYQIIDRSVDEKILYECYQELYHQRNRIAHNTSSYQHNLPTLQTLKSEEGYSRNYFIWFTILILIDEIFIELYKIFFDTKIKFNIDY